MSVEQDLIEILSPELYRYLLQTLRNTLPRLPNETPEARTERDTGAIAFIASLRPADIIETQLALQIVLLEAHARDCFREADDPSLSHTGRLKCHTQGAAMMRQSESSLKLLLQMQKRRAKAKNVVASERARESERRWAAVMEQTFAKLQRADQAAADQRTLEQRLRDAPACFIHEPGDPTVLN